MRVDGSSSRRPKTRFGFSPSAILSWRGAPAKRSSSSTNDGRSFGLHPSLGPLRDLFAGGQAALVANVGTLVVPTTRAQYRSGSVPLPLQLYSHIDQQYQWQTAIPERRSTTGWGGRLADLTNAFNENPGVSMSISVDGQNTFQVGRSTAQLNVHRNGVVQLNGSGRAAGAVRVGALRDLLGYEHDGLMEAAFGATTRNALDSSGDLAAALESVPEPAGAFPAGRLGDQLRMIARLISIAPQFGLRRQVFFARLGGWDLHDSQMDAHAALLGELGQALKAFHDATAAMGRASDVTTFTASDFGRTLTTNGDGSDHGWGSHHVVVGGAVQGGDIYGSMPVMAVDGPDDAGRGRWIPTTSVDEYAATLARWFGVSATDLPVVLPNIERFARPDLGFMA